MVGVRDTLGVTEDVGEEDGLRLMDGVTEAVVVGVTVRVTLADADPEGDAEGLRDGTLAVGEGLPDREADPERETVGEKEDVTVGVGDLESVREVDTDLVMDWVVEVDPVNDEEIDMVGVPEGGGVCEGEAVRVAGLGVGDFDREGLGLGALVADAAPVTEGVGEGDRDWVAEADADTLADSVTVGDADPVAEADTVGVGD